LILLAAIGIFVSATISSMVGIGGGAFYVPILLLLGLPFHTATSTSVFIILFMATVASTRYIKEKKTDIPLAAVAGSISFASALVAGMFANRIPLLPLKLLLIAVLLLSAFSMIFDIPVAGNRSEKRRGRFIWQREKEGERYFIGLPVLLPMKMLAGVFSALLGIGGGIIYVPTFVALFGVPVAVAIGTSTLMTAGTSFASFVGHAVAGDVRIDYALPFVIAGILGGIAGPYVSLKLKKEILKRVLGVVLLVLVGVLAYRFIRSG